MTILYYSIVNMLAELATLCLVISACLTMKVGHAPPMIPGIIHVILLRRRKSV